MFDIFEEIKRITRQHCEIMGYGGQSAEIPLAQDEIPMSLRKRENRAESEDFLYGDEREEFAKEHNAREF